MLKKMLAVLTLATTASAQFDFTDLLEDLSKEAQTTVRVGTVKEFNGANYECTLLDTQTLVFTLIDPVDPGELFFLAGGNNAIRTLTDKLGVIIVPSIYQRSFDPDLDGLIDENLLRTVIADKIPIGYTGVIHFNLEHPKIVSDLINPGIPASDPGLQWKVNEVVKVFQITREERPECLPGNWSFVGPGKWLPAWATQIRTGVKGWDNISEADRQLVFDKYRDPFFNTLYEEIGYFNPNAYTSYNWNDSSWYRNFQLSWQESIIEITTEIANGKPCQMSFNVRFGQGPTFGEEIPRAQLWEQIEMVLDAGWSFSLWGITAASQVQRADPGWDGYYWQNDVKGENYRRVTEPELLAAGVDLNDEQAICDYFTQWSLDLTQYIYDKVAEWQESQ